MFGLGALISSSKEPPSRWAASPTWDLSPYWNFFYFWGPQRQWTHPWFCFVARYLQHKIYQKLQVISDTFSGSSQQQSSARWQEQVQLRRDTSRERNRWRSQSWESVSQPRSWRRVRSSGARRCEARRGWRAFKTGAAISPMLSSALICHTGNKTQVLKVAECRKLCRHLCVHKWPKVDSIVISIFVVILVDFDKYWMQHLSRLVWPKVVFVMTRFPQIL